MINYPKNLFKKHSSEPYHSIDFQKIKLIQLREFAIENNNKELLQLVDEISNDDEASKNFEFEYLGEILFKKDDSYKWKECWSLKSNQLNKSLVFEVLKEEDASVTYVIECEEPLAKIQI